MTVLDKMPISGTQPINVYQDSIAQCLCSGVSSDALGIALTLARLLPAATEDTDKMAWTKSIGDVAVALDHFGQFEEAAAFWSKFPVSQWAEDVRSLPVVIDNADFLLGRAKVWTILAWLQHCRRNYSAESERGPNELLGFLETCIRYVERSLQHASIDNRRCYATLGACYAMKGFVCGDLGWVAEADRWFGEAAQMYQRRLELPFVDKDRERRVALRRIARVQILGSAWLKLAKGALDEALFIVSAAGVQLVDSEDEVLRAFARMLRGCIIRAKAGSNTRLLDEAIDALRGAQATFEKVGHRSYHARACFELAIAYFHSGDDESADRFLDAANESGATKPWHCNILIMKSRILRRRDDFDGAVKMSEQAIRIARAHHSPVLGEAYVALGEALLSHGRAKDAIRSFEQASDDSSQNPKLRAVCCIHLARTLFYVGRTDSAHEWLAQYRQLEPSVQNGFVRSFARQVESQLNFEDSLVISGTGELLYRAHELRLRGFLLRAAKKRFKDVAKIVTALGVSKQTFYSWQREIAGQSDPALQIRIEEGPERAESSADQSVVTEKPRVSS